MNEARKTIADVQATLDEFKTMVAPELRSRFASMNHNTCSDDSTDDSWSQLEQVQIILTAKDWEAFCRALDEPPKLIPAIRELFSKPSIFEIERRAGGSTQAAE